MSVETKQPFLSHEMGYDIEKKMWTWTLAVFMGYIIMILMTIRSTQKLSK